MEHDKQCILVIIGADQWGRKELLAIAGGYRESAQSWREVLLDLKLRYVDALAPGAANRNLDEPKSRHRRCIVRVLLYRSSRL